MNFKIFCLVFLAFLSTVYEESAAKPTTSRCKQLYDAYRALEDETSRISQERQHMRHNKREYLLLSQQMDHIESRRHDAWKIWNNECGDRKE